MPRTIREAARAAAVRRTIRARTTQPVQQVPIQIVAVPTPVVNNHNQADNAESTNVSGTKKGFCTVAGAAVGSAVGPVFLPGLAAQVARAGMGFALQPMSISRGMGVLTAAKAAAYNAGRLAAIESIGATSYAYTTTAAPAIGAATGGAVGLAASSAICWATPKVLHFTAQTAVPFVWNNAVKPAGTGLWHGACSGVNAIKSAFNQAVAPALARCFRRGPSI